MSGEDKAKESEKTKESTGSKDSKKPDTSKTSTTTSSSSSSSNMGFGNPRSVVPLLDRDDDEIQDDEGMKRSLRQMCICPPRPFDPKNDRNFESWLNQIEFHFEVTKCPVED